MSSPEMKLVRFGRVLAKHLVIDRARRGLQRVREWLGMRVVMRPARDPLGFEGFLRCESDQAVSLWPPLLRRPATSSFQAFNAVEEDARAIMMARRLDIRRPRQAAVGRAKRGAAKQGQRRRRSGKKGAKKGGAGMQTGFLLSAEP